MSSPVTSGSAAPAPTTPAIPPYGPTPTAPPPSGPLGIKRRWWLLGGCAALALSCISCVLLLGGVSFIRNRVDNANQQRAIAATQTEAAKPPTPTLVIATVTPIPAVATTALTQVPAVAPTATLIIATVTPPPTATAVPPTATRIPPTAAPTQAPTQAPTTAPNPTAPRPTATLDIPSRVGLTGRPLTEARAKELGSAVTGGFEVTQVTPNSLAALASLKAGDVVFMVGETAVESLEDIMAEIKPGQTLELGVARGAEFMGISVTIPNR